MTLYEYFLVFPEGDVQPISHPVMVSTLLDMNGNALSLPLPTNKMLVYQVVRKRTIEAEIGIVKTYYLLEQLDAFELCDYL